MISNKKPVWYWLAIYLAWAVPHTQVRKWVRDEVYWTITELSGHGFFYREIQIAIQVVQNTLFDTKWKLPRELDKDHYDIDSNERKNESEFDAATLPTRKNMWKMLKKLRHVI